MKKPRHPLNCKHRGRWTFQQRAFYPDVQRHGDSYVCSGCGYRKILYIDLPKETLSAS